MLWWHYILIVVGVGLLGWIKLKVFNNMKSKMTTKKKFSDEE